MRPLYAWAATAPFMTSPSRFRPATTLAPLATALAMACASVPASAASFEPVKVTGPVFTNIGLGTFTLAAASHIAGVLGFTPYITVPSFELGASVAPADIALGYSSTVTLAPSFNITLPEVSFSAVSVYNTLQAVTTPGQLNSYNVVFKGYDFTFSDLAAGTYALRTSGMVAGSNQVEAQYAFTLVPEPEAFLMLLAGLCVVGGVAHRRRRTGR